MRVICKLPNAARVISDVAFTPLDPLRVVGVNEINAMISEEVSNEVGAYFLLVPGFERADEPKQQQSDLSEVRRMASAGAPLIPADGKPPATEPVVTPQSSQAPADPGAAPADPGTPAVTPSF